MNVTFPGVFGRKSDAVITKWYGEDGKTVQEGEPLYAFEAFRRHQHMPHLPQVFFIRKWRLGRLSVTGR